ncbi:MAG TPA: FAD-dependent monooxygenase [Pilimelia sp.]|nr:FAD-dependent monooxygenase [Pilimelia sp.]
MRTSVLVVGGGVVGLTGALFLARHGVPCVLVERHPDLLIHPRSRGLTPRTMEVYRQAGLEQAIKEAAFGGAGFAYVPVRANTLADDEYAVPDEPHEDDGSAASPCGFGPIDQDRLEILVRDRAREFGADLRFATELTSFTQHGDGVTATVTDRATGASATIDADYLVAADGLASPIRHRLGIPVDGPGPMFTTMTAIVEADLTPALRGRTASIAYLQQPRPFTILMAHDDAGLRWVFGTGYDPRHESLADFTDERVADMVRAAAGLPDAAVRLRPQVPGTDLTVLGFPIGAHVARSYRAGRGFLAGDAAHVWPPTGGLGANAGIQDAHNLAWKLAMVLDGNAGAGLLDTYDAERRPTGLLTMEQAMARFGTRMGPGDGPDLIDYGAVSMGYRYPTPGGGDTGPVPPRELAGQPGTRAPHVPVTLAGRDISTLDLYGSHLVLITGGAGDGWTSAAAKLDVPVDAYRLGAEVCSAYGIEAGGVSLVRPDGFVAWRANSGVPDPARTLADAVRSVLFR